MGGHSTGRVLVTVLHDSAEAPSHGPRILDVAHIASTEPARPSDRATAPDAHTRVTLDEAAPGAPWVFSKEDADAPAPRRVLLLGETPNVMDVLVRWATTYPAHEPYGQRDYDGFFNNPNLMTTTRAIPAPQKATFTKRRRPTEPT